MPESSHLLLAVLFSVDLQNCLAGTWVCGSPSESTKITVCAQTHFRAKSHCNDAGSFPKCTASFSSFSQAFIPLAWGHTVGLARGDPEWDTATIPDMQPIVTQEWVLMYTFRLYQIRVVVTLTVQRFEWKKKEKHTLERGQSSALFLSCTERLVNP